MKNTEATTIEPPVLITLDIYDINKNVLRPLKIRKDLVKSAKVDEKNPCQLNVVYVNGFKDSYIHINRESAKGFENQLNGK